MNKKEALELHELLKDLLPAQPGENISAVSQAKNILFKFQNDTTSNSYLIEKIRTYIENLETWCSAKRWQKLPNYKVLQNYLRTDLNKIEAAIEQCY